MFKLFHPPPRALHIVDENSSVFWSDLYQTSVLGLAVLIPLLLAPPAILVASVRYSRVLEADLDESAAGIESAQFLSVLFLFQGVGRLTLII